MKLHCRLTLLALLGLLPCSRAALGQRTYALGVGGGAVIPVGKLGDTQSMGYNGIVVLAIGVAELPFGLRIDGIYNNLLNNDRLVPGGSLIPYDLRVLGALGNLIFAFSGTSAKPYVLAGGGLYAVRPDTAGAKSKNHLGFNAGVGATFAVGPFAAFIESRYHTISRTAENGGVIQFVPITIGLLF